MKIKPAYTTFEQAKFLKEKGFNEPTTHLYEYALTSQKDEETGEYSGAFGWEKGECNLIQGYFINNYTSDYSNENWYMCSAPEQWQIIEWLRINHGIWIEVRLSYFGEFVTVIKRPKRVELEGSKSTPQEAYSVAFDYIFKNNLI